MYKVIDCAPFDMFIIRGTGTSAAGLWTFTDNDGYILSQVSGSIDARNNPEYIFAPAGATKLIINSGSNFVQEKILNYESAKKYASYVYNTLKSRYDTYMGNSDITYTAGGFITLNGVTTNFNINENSSYSYTIIDCSPYDMFVVRGTSGSSLARIWAFTDADGKILTRADANIDARNNPEYIFAPAGATKLIINTSAPAYKSERIMTFSALKGALGTVDYRFSEVEKEISILFVGNSLTQDSISYLPYLLKHYYPDIHFRFYMFYNGGRTLADQYSIMSANTPCATFSKSENEERWYNSNATVTMNDILTTYTFDIVCMQEYFNTKTAYTITDLTDWNNCRDYITSNYTGGNGLEFISLFHAPSRKIESEDAETNVIDKMNRVYALENMGNALIIKETICNDMIPAGIALYNAISTNLDSLGDMGHLTVDGIHAQEGLPCLLQTYTVACWLFDRIGGRKRSIYGCPLRITEEVYNAIKVPGPNLGTGIITGTDEQNLLAQEIAIKAYQEAKEFILNELNYKISNTKMLFTWEAGAFNNSGVESNTGALATMIRTSNSVIVPDGEITATYHRTFDGLEDGTVIARLRVQKPDESVQIVTVGSSNYDIPYTITVEPGSSVRFFFIRSTGSEANLEIDDGDKLIEDAYVSTIVNTKEQELAYIKQNINESNGIKNDIYTIWERGSLSSTGNNSASTSTTIIRTKSAVHIAEDTLQYEVPSGYTMTIAVYDGSTHKGNTAGITGNGTFNLTNGHDIRLVLQKSSGDAIPTEDGYLVNISTIKELVESVESVVSRTNRNILANYMSFSIFQKFGVIGDSFASGSIHHPDDGGWTGNYDMSWAQILARSCGAEAVNFTKGGLSTKTWLSDATYGLSKLLSTPVQQLYIIALGINDNTQINAGTLTLGSISDVNDDYTQNPDTFFGNYGRIIGNIKTYAPYAKIACLSVARPQERNMDTYIHQIADKMGVPFIDLTADEYFTSAIYYGSMFSSHPIVYGYAGMAKAIERLICLDVLNNTGYWGTYYGLVAEDTSINPEE